MNVSIEFKYRGRDYTTMEDTQHYNHNCKNRIEFEDAMASLRDDVLQGHSITDIIMVNDNGVRLTVFDETDQIEMLQTLELMREEMIK